MRLTWPKGTSVLLTAPHPEGNVRGPLPIDPHLNAETDIPMTDDAELFISHEKMKVYSKERLKNSNRMIQGIFLIVKGLFCLDPG